MKTKRFTALLISTLMILQMFVIGTSAAYIPQQDNPTTISYIIPTEEADWTPEVPNAEESETVYPDLESIPYVEAGLISVDGEKDAAYENAVSVVFGEQTDDASGTSATVSMLTNNGLLYLYADITDAQMIMPAQEIQQDAPWDTDSIEFLFQTRNNSFDDIHQFRVDVTDYLCYYRNHNGDQQAYGDLAEEYFVSHDVVLHDNGYTVEFCIDTKMFGVSAGEAIGIQFQINDAVEDGSVYRYNYCPTEWVWSPENYDEVLIGVDEEYTSTREIQTEGQCGDNLTWSIDENGVLTISGSGEMYAGPFGDIKSMITSVVIEEGVTTIGNNAFQECNSLVALTLPDSLQIIGNWAFAQSEMLKTVTLGENITHIDDCAFLGCTALESVVFNNCNPSMGDWIFERCTSLGYADLGNALTGIGVGMFFDCSALDEIYFRGNAPVEIHEDAFSFVSQDLKLYWFEGTDGWDAPYWWGPNDIEYKTVCLAADTKIPLGIPNIAETTMIDPNAMGIENVDGFKEDVYNDTVIVCDKLADGFEDTGAYAEVSMVSHSGYLFLYAEVTDTAVIDPNPQMQENEPWNTDSFEFFLRSQTAYFDDIHQFRLDASGYPSYYRVDFMNNGEIESVNGEDAKAYFEAYEVIRTETGYVVEACIDVRKYGVSYTDEVGIQMQVNDMTEDGYAIYRYYPSNDPFNTENYDTVIIKGEFYTTTRDFVKPEESYRGVVAKTDPAAIAIDGYLNEAAWADALQIPIGQRIHGEDDTGTRGFAYMLWSEGKWYLYINVNDDNVATPIPELQETEPWRTDSVEMFFDFGNKHEHIVEQFRLDCSSYPSYYWESDLFHAYGDEAAPYFDNYAVTIDDEGYNIEMCLNLDNDEYGLTEGYEIGIQMQVNDMVQGSEDLAAIYVMGSALGADSWNVACYDYVTLGGQIESQVPDTTDYDAYLNTTDAIVEPGDTFYVEFFIPEEEDKMLTTSGFALSNFVYNEDLFAIDAENIEILADPLIRDITNRGNVVMAFDPAAELSGTIIRVPFTVRDTASRGTSIIQCTAQYQANKVTERLLTKQASIFINSEKIGKPADSYRGEVVKVDSNAIQIDGIMDESEWADALQITIGDQIHGDDTGTRGFAYMLWANEKWYLYVNVYDKDVADPIPELQETEPWRTDSVEMFFDFGNDHSQLVSQFRLDCSGYASYYVEGDVFHAYGADAEPYFEDFKVTVDEEGYNIEMCLNMAPYGLDIGDEIGIQMQVNDMVQDSPDLAAIYVMGSALGAASWDVPYYDYIKLSSEADHTADVLEGGALVSDIAEGEAVHAGDIVVLDFVISLDDFTTTRFALANFLYSTSAFTMLTDEITISDGVNALTHDISDNGNIMLAFDSETTLTDVIVSIPFMVNNTASTGNFEISCTAQYQGDKATRNMQVKSAVISVQGETLLGDVDGDGVVSSEDAILLLWYVFEPEAYEIHVPSVDFNGDGAISSADAVYLLWHVFTPDEYPLH